MRTVIFLLFLAVFVLPLAAGFFSLSAAAADASACYTINGADARAYCRAKAKEDPSICYNIQSSALRNQCLAEVRK